MALTASQAIDRLSGIDTPGELRELISQLDVTGESSGVTILYSGGDSWSIVNKLVEQGEDIRIIDGTEAAQFLDLNENTALRNKLSSLFPDSEGWRVRGSEINRFLFGDAEYVDGRRVAGSRQPTGAWDIVSRNFVEATTGEVRTLIDRSSAALDGTFAQVEIPALLGNSAITRVEGIPLNELIDLNSHASVFANLGTISDFNVQLSGLEGGYVESNYVVRAGGYLNSWEAEVLGTTDRIWLPVKRRVSVGDNQYCCFRKQAA
jgi:hypothetical protein